ncbi:MAG TPA: Crp/Fnr family transcriptional regulator [Acidobacteriota bacterium]|nr:Crp/Fnr family transcriptional regulator [Acidobacteriota bacterium]
MAGVRKRDERRIKALSETALFGRLSPKELTPLLERCHEVHFEPGDLIFSAGEASRGLFVVMRGRTRAFRHGSDGREQIIHEDGPSATFPEVAVFDDGPYPSSVVAVEVSELLFLPKQEVRQFCVHHPAAALAALKLLSTRLRRTTRMVEGFALRNVSQRIGEYLLNQSGERSAGGEVSMEFTLVHSNQEIADSVGTVREVVSRSFSKLQQFGWVVKTGRRVRIQNYAALEGYSKGEDSDI